MKITESKHIRQEVPKSTLEELAETPSTSLHKTLAAVGAQESTAFRPGSFKLGLSAETTASHFCWKHIMQKLENSKLEGKLIKL